MVQIQKCRALKKFLNCHCRISMRSLYSSVAEHWSCKPGVESSILSGGKYYFLCHIAKSHTKHTECISRLQRAVSSFPPAKVNVCPDVRDTTEDGRKPRPHRSSFSLARSRGTRGKSRGACCCCAYVLILSGGRGMKAEYTTASERQQKRQTRTNVALPPSLPLSIPRSVLG